MRGFDELAPLVEYVSAGPIVVAGVEVHGDSLRQRLELPEADRAVLVAALKAHTSSQRNVLRARIVLT